MPHYYFHIRDGIRLVNDAKGKDYQDLDAAKAEAVRLAAEVRADFVTANGLVQELKVEITDAAGAILGMVPLASA